MHEAEIDPEVAARLQTICMAFPDAVEDWESVGRPVFKVRKKIFAMQHGHQGRPSLWIKAPPGMQAPLVAAQPDRLFVPPYVGSKGWIGLWLDGEPDWAAIADFIDESYRMTASQRQIAALDARSGAG
jgi:predicted DNA-binding protein (MmcQ/YjbR family)